MDEKDIAERIDEDAAEREEDRIERENEAIADLAGMPVEEDEE